MPQRSGAQQLANYALLDWLSPFFEPGVRVIDEARLTAPAASVTFASIPQFYRDLELSWSGRSDRALTSTDLALRCNGDFGANYDWFRHYSVCGAAALTSQCVFATTQMYIGHIEALNATANTYSGGFVRIYAYRATDRYKRVAAPTAGAFGNLAGANVFLQHMEGQWRNQNAITSLTVFALGGNLIAGTVMTLRGIL